MSYFRLQVCEENRAVFKSLQVYNLDILLEEYNFEFNTNMLNLLPFNGEKIS